MNATWSSVSVCQVLISDCLAEFFGFLDALLWLVLLVIFFVCFGFEVGGLCRFGCLRTQAVCICLSIKLPLRFIEGAFHLPLGLICVVLNSFVVWAEG